MPSKITIMLMSTKKTAYIHGFDPKEQKRLIDQAAFLEPWVYDGIDFGAAKRILEVGCGVGAQTKILLKRFPKLKIDAVDLSIEQLDMARSYLKREISQGRVRLFQADASNLSSLEKNAYDGAYICWFLEHVKDPVRVLKQTRARLKKGARLYASEVFNQTLFVEPYAPAFMKYWFEFNDFQWTIGGHPFIGASLGNHLLNAGFQKISTEVRPFHFDAREKKDRASFTAFFEKILLSAAPELLKDKRVSLDTVNELKREFQIVRKSKDAVFFYSFIRAMARV
jgi:ubiquinone/menaquinone biosynthesis C-methylase UbiE